MVAIERRTLKKAPTRDVVEAFTQPIPESSQPAPKSIGETSGANRATPAPTPRAGVDQHPQQPVAVPRQEESLRRGPGRPRSKRRMEPFSSKLDIELRDEIDAYLFKHGGTFVDLLDQALRAHIQK